MSQPSPAKPPFRYYLRVRYHECDAQRVVFNGNYGTYVDMALTEFLTTLIPDRHASLQHEANAPALEFQLVRQLIEWTGPARLNDIVEISAWCERVGTTSFVMRFALRKAGKPKPFVTAETVNVVMDGRSWVKIPIDPLLRDKLLTGASGVRIDHAGYLENS
jgi:acyl-CoA thioester hydrolase